MNRRHFHRTLLTAGSAALLAPAEGLAALARAAARQAVAVDGERLMRQLFALSEHGRTADGGVSRVAYSDADRAGRAYVLGLMNQAGLEVETDAAGNLIGRLVGSEPGLRPIGFGSHIDSVPNGGNYDGPVGSLAAIEVARVLHRSGTRTRHPLEVLIFSNEEGGLIGSRPLAGQLPERELDQPTHSGLTVREGILSVGGDPLRLNSIRRAPGDLAAFIELHIEQGGVLEKEGVDIGVVEGIVGIGWWDVSWTGFANHAGTTPMDQRQDALLSAARFVQRVNEVAHSEPGRHVATVGRIQAQPGAPNVIPGKVVHSLEIRDLEETRMRALFDRMRAEAQEIASASGTEVGFEELTWLVPAPADPRVQVAVESAAKSLSLSHRRMPSGAGHDAQSMARIAPTGMIFVPSVGGVSHSPKEFSHPEDVINGANVLLRTVLQLDREL